MATLKDIQMVFKTNYRLMQIKSIAEREHSAILSTFIKLPFATLVLCISEWPAVLHRFYCTLLEDLEECPCCMNV